MIRKNIQWQMMIAAIAASFQCCLPSVASSYARDMFYQQLKEPTAAPAAFSGTHTHHGSVSAGHAANTGLSFYIEMVRGGRTSKVDSRTKFRGGDKIKFHIVSNVDGYAHVVMLQGSSGNQAVLFPVQGKDPTNHMVRGKEYTIPSVTWLVFDNTPGREHVRIAITKRDEDPAKFLQPQATSQLAMAQISPNPAIDPSGGKEQIKVSYKEDIPKPTPIVRPAVGTPPAAVQEAAAPVAPPTNDAPIANAIPDEDSSKDLFREDSGPGHSSRPATHHVVHHVSHASSYHPVYRPSHSSYRPPSVYTPPAPPPTTVVLNTNANEDLYADISLEHD